MILKRALHSALTPARAAILHGSKSISALPPPLFLLSARARHFNSTNPIIEPSSNDVLDLSISAINSDATSIPPPSHLSDLSTPPSSTDTPSADLHPSIPALLPLLIAQKPHYITAHIHDRPYLITEGDTVRLPFQMPHVLPGDILRFTRASILGSRDFTLKGAPYLDEALFVCRARVVGVEAEPMRVMKKTKRRQRRVKTVRSKHKHTILRVCEVVVRQPEGL